MPDTEQNLTEAFNPEIVTQLLLYLAKNKVTGTQFAAAAFAIIAANLQQIPDLDSRITTSIQQIEFFKKCLKHKSWNTHQ